MDVDSITEADERAAHALWQSEGTGPSMHTMWPQAFAAHRIAATSAKDKRIAELEAALRPFAEAANVFEEQWGKTTSENSGAMLKTAHLIAARKALTP